MSSFTVLGVDLAGAVHRATGMCVLKDMMATTFISHSDEEILECAEREKPGLIAVDAPLNLPPGRKSIEDRNGTHFRVCDIELRKRNIRFFPITLGPMRMLTVRGISLRKKLEIRGFPRRPSMKPHRKHIRRWYPVCGILSHPYRVS